MSDDFVELDYYQAMTLLVVCGELKKELPNGDGLGVIDNFLRTLYNEIGNILPNPSIKEKVRRALLNKNGKLSISKNSYNYIKALTDIDVFDPIFLEILEKNKSDLTPSVEDFTDDIRRK